MKLLFACDGSSNADTALTDLARAGLPAKGEALILAIADAWPHLGEAQFHLVEHGAEGWLAPPLIEAARQAAQTALTQAGDVAAATAAKLRPLLPGWNIQPESAADAPQWAILKKAESWGADLIVMGAAGVSLLGRLMLGSVSHSVLTHAHGSVRIGRSTRPNQPPISATYPIRLLIGVDGSAGSAAAVSAVLLRIWPDGTQARVVTVADAFVATSIPVDGLAAAWSLPMFDKSSHWVTQAAYRAARRLGDAGLTATPVILPGNPKKVLLEEAERFQADCIFLGAKGLSGIDRFLIGSVSTAVAERAHCSVEVVRSRLETIKW